MEVTLVYSQHSFIITTLMFSVITTDRHCLDCLHRGIHFPTGHDGEHQVSHSRTLLLLSRLPRLLH